MTIDTLRKFVMPEVIIGDGARNRAGLYLENYGIQHLLLVTDPGVIRAGWVDEISTLAEDHGVDLTVFDGVSENPRTDEVHAGAGLYHRAGCDGILAIGGGSPMDSAKGISILATNGGDIRGYEGVDQIRQMGPPLICIPTTAGSSADVSQFAILTDQAAKRKFAIISKMIIPDISLIDPALLATLPREFVAYSGFDALTHAIEAYVSTGSSPLTDLHACEAIQLIRTALPKAYRSRDDSSAALSMMLGSLHAGLAFSNASLGLVHAMGHAISGMYNLPHGEVNSLLLPYVIRHNFPAARERYNRIATMLGLPVGKIHENGPDAIIDAIRCLGEDVGITGTLGDRGMMSSHIPDLASSAVLDPCIVTNPNIPEREEVIALYEAAL
ncbi:alcohol dehydrogenase [Methanocalculus chunghsingensis]|uniref:Alcohol dehydrogenase n=1 Tax=Methanocalculus chunghsingensis TaxID=156457 RepID=A0A8J8B4B2_9EURY|nr:iron-containing alcohol dehydrogenase [Methanocalculus chunghsingensis]MBR1368561.1 alcohol dehydrogenase [Methanocalculus chunghsingensis]